MPTAAILNQERERWARKQTSTLSASTAVSSASIAKSTTEVLTAQTAVLSASAAKQTSVVLSASTTAPSASIFKQIGAVLSASMSFAGSLVKQTSRSVSAATATLSGSLSKRTGAVLSAALTFSATASKQTAQVIAGAFGFAAAVSKQASRAIAATFNFSGSIGKQTSLPLQAAFGFVMTIAKQTGVTLQSALGFSASAVKQVGVSLSASMKFSGVLSQTKSKLVAFLASMGFVAAGSRQTSKPVPASSSFSAVLPKKTNRSMSATLTLSASANKIYPKAFAAVMATLSAVWTTIYQPFVPVVVYTPASLGTVTSPFGVSSTNPAIVHTRSAGLQTFNQPDRLSIPGFGHPRFGTPNGSGLQGHFAMPGQLLVLPGNGKLNGASCQIVAGGDFTIPSSGVTPTISFSLNQNYFTNPTPSGNASSIVIKSDQLAKSPAVSVPVGGATWQLICKLSGNRGQGILIGDYVLTINGQVSTGQLYSNLNPTIEPNIQLSLAVQFGGAVSGPDVFQARMMQFEIQQP